MSKGKMNELRTKSSGAGFGDRMERCQSTWNRNQWPAHYITYFVWGKFKKDHQRRGRWQRRTLGWQGRGRSGKDGICKWTSKPWKRHGRRRWKLCLTWWTTKLTRVDGNWVLNQWRVTIGIEAVGIIAQQSQDFPMASQKLDQLHG
jgi:hypothetical protein